MSSDAQLELAQAELALKRASAARAEEEVREHKEALRAAVAAGKELQLEYARLDHAFRDAERAVLRKTLVWSTLNETIAAHVAAKPDEVEDFANEDEIEEWTRAGIELREEYNLMYAEMRALCAVRDPLRLAGLKAYNALEYQRGVVRNLRNKITDPEEGFMRRGWQGGLAGVR